MSTKRPVQFLSNSQVVVLDYADLLDENGTLAFGGINNKI